MPPWPRSDRPLGHRPLPAAKGKTVVLRDGSAVLIRPVRPEDAGLLEDGFAGLSDRSRRLRFLGPKASLSAAEIAEQGFVTLVHSLDVLRHSAAHILATAVRRLRPEAKIGFGPSIDDGFYYDFEVAQPFTPEDLTAFEAEMTAAGADWQLLVLGGAQHGFSVPGIARPACAYDTVADRRSWRAMLALFEDTMHA